MGQVLTKIPDAMNIRQSATFFNDFYDLSPVFTKLSADVGASGTIGTADNGILPLVTGATDNNEAEIYTLKIFTMKDSRSIVGEALIQYSEAATNAANIAFGFWSTNGADVLADNGGGPATTASGFMFYKVDGGSVWKCITSKSTTQTISTVKTSGQPTTSVPGNSAYVRLRVEFSAYGDMGQDTGEVTFWIDGKQVYDAADTTKNTPIKHQVTYTSAAAMSLIAYVKAGSATSETLNIDYVGFSQTRAYGV